MIILALIASNQIKDHYCKAGNYHIHFTFEFNHQQYTLKNFYQFVVLIVNINLLIKNKDGVNGDVGAHVRQVVVVVFKKEFEYASLLFHFHEQTLSTVNVF